MPILQARLEAADCFGQLLFNLTVEGLSLRRSSFYFYFSTMEMVFYVWNTTMKVSFSVYFSTMEMVFYVWNTTIKTTTH